MAIKPAVRQMRGPGMNKGLKKPRFGKFPKPPKGSAAEKSVADAQPSSPRKDYKKGSSYLSKNIWK